MGTGHIIISRSIAGRDVRIEVVPSALKHGKAIADISAALDYEVYDETLVADPNKTLVVGFDVSGNLTEVIFHKIADDYIVVFHAMACRKVYLEKVLQR
jgi:hypothetical protein